MTGERSFGRIKLLFVRMNVDLLMGEDLKKTGAGNLFTGGGDPYKRLKTALRAEIDTDAWESLYQATSRPFERLASGRIAVKVINDHGDEVMKVFDV